MKFIDYVILNDLGIIETNRSFKELTTIGCGGKIDVLYTPKDVDSLSKAYKFIIENDINYFILGNGSNILASDYDFKGIVINLRKMQYNFYIEGNYLECSAFYPTMKLAYDLALLEQGNLSFLGGIPGLLGGAIYNNSGAYGDDISKYIIDVKYINTVGDIVNLSKKDCGFGYRKSIFHYVEGIIISARFKIEKKETYSDLERRRKERLLAQPLDTKNMGSVFKNNPIIPAWKVIDALGLRGFKIGGAAVSSKHANFIINTGTATSKDVETLIDLIKRRAKLELGINMCCEIKIM